MTDYTPKSFKLDKKVVKALELAAKREDRTQTAIIERAIMDYVSKGRAPAAEPTQTAPAETAVIAGA